MIKKKCRLGLGEGLVEIIALTTVLTILTIDCAVLAITGYFFLHQSLDFILIFKHSYSSTSVSNWKTITKMS